MAIFSKTKASMSVSFYHFHPRWTVNYGEEIEKRYEEFEDVVKAGYTNCILVSVDYINDDEFWRIAIENDCTVWINIFNYFDSSRQSYEEWNEVYDAAYKKLMANPERWERFMGVHIDEPVWRGQSNEDFLTQTKRFYLDYGKRVFPVFATGEFMDSEGNALQLKMDAANMKKVIPEALEYVTDVAFDSYSVDVRDGYPNGDFVERVEKKLPGVVDGKSYYEKMTDRLLRIVGHEVNVWFFPTAYTCATWGGNKANEGFCKGHLEFFTDLLSKYDHPGGLVLYTYHQFKNVEEFGARDHLVLKGEDGKQKLRPHCAKWPEYSNALKKVCQKFRETTVEIVK